MNTKKAIYLGLIVSLLIIFTSRLFYQKSILLRTGAAASELQQALLAYIEKEESYPKGLQQIKFNDRGLHTVYELLENGRGCRFIIEGKVFELWDEER